MEKAEVAATSAADEKKQVDLSSIFTVFEKNGSVSTKIMVVNILWGVLSVIYFVSIFAPIDFVIDVLSVYTVSNFMTVVSVFMIGLFIYGAVITFQRNARLLHTVIIFI